MLKQEKIEILEKMGDTFRVWITNKKPDTPLRVNSVIQDFSVKEFLRSFKPYAELMVQHGFTEIECIGEKTGIKIVAFWDD